MSCLTRQSLYFSALALTCMKRDIRMTELIATSQFNPNQSHSMPCGLYSHQPELQGVSVTYTLRKRLYPRTKVRLQRMDSPRIVFPRSLTCEIIGRCNIEVIKQRLERRWCPCIGSMCRNFDASLRECLHCYPSRSNMNRSIRRFFSLSFMPLSRSNS